MYAPVADVDASVAYFNRRISKMKLPMSACVAAIGTLLAMPAWSCSICRCGDPTFNALGKEGVAQSGLRLALDWDEVRKTQGDPAGEVESLRERRETLLIAYGFSDRFGVFARLPYSQRQLTAVADGEMETTRVSGLADPEIYGQARLGSSGFEGAVGTRASLYAVFGVKTPWGENNASRDGVRLDEHVQPGTGSTDWFGGLSGSYQVDPESAVFASVQYRVTGRSDVGYRYGRATLLNFAYEHKLNAKWDAVIEVNYRYAGLDQTDASGVTDADTGGSIVYITPRLLFDAGNGWVVRASVQLPLTQSGLNGNQREKTVLNAGMTHLFGK
jgi:hypothetical protein